MRRIKVRIGFILFTLAAASWAGAKSKPKPLPVVDRTDCSAICDKDQACKPSFWQKKHDCVFACEDFDDPSIGETYSCVAHATDCLAVRECGKTKKDQAPGRQ